MLVSRWQRCIICSNISSPTTIDCSIDNYDNKVNAFVCSLQPSQYFFLYLLYVLYIKSGLEHHTLHIPYEFEVVHKYIRIILVALFNHWKFWILTRFTFLFKWKSAHRQYEQQGLVQNSKISLQNKVRLSREFMK